MLVHSAPVLRSEARLGYLKVSGLCFYPLAIPSLPPQIIQSLIYITRFLAFFILASARQYVV